ncbi:cupin domain-containing protein [Tabrizicola sp. J26]|uniref:cupin domain-containing protein n=1 Tax=Alitabrizicola rongguiensis TaxID=2909234 RepID=UPI001F2354C0|nr:cupin domain-containing protein [Tabrizicola rongguiensis]MCF1707859.1 cupin domain-containing protein [Tabrizicola rongguiensis]
MQSSPILRLEPHLGLAPWPDQSAEVVSSGDVCSSGHVWFEDKAAGLGVGVWEAGPTIGRWMIWSAHEFMLIVEGEVVIVEEDRETVFRAGDALFIPKGVRCLWAQAGRVRKIFAILDDGRMPAGQNGRVIRIDPSAHLDPASPPLATNLLSSVPQTWAHNAFEDETGQLSTGIWQATAYERKQVSFTHTELMHVLEGTISLTDAAGQTQHFGPGQTLLLPAGTPNAWLSTGLVRKVFWTFSPRA